MADNPSTDEIKQARQAAGLTQTAAAEVVYKSMRAWQQWEAGERAMPRGLYELFLIRTGQESASNTQ